MRFLPVAIIAIAVCGCTTTEQANKLVASKYMGGQTDAFFTKFGPPESSYKLQSGDTLFTWAERARYWNTPGSVQTTVVGRTAISTVTPGDKVLQQCQLKILASPDGRIREINVLNDSLGVWQLSRCNEVFS